MPKLQMNERNLGLRFMVTSKLRDEIDIYCKEEDLNISQLLRRAVEEYLKNHSKNKGEK